MIQEVFVLCLSSSEEGPGTYSASAVGSGDADRPCNLGGATKRYDALARALAGAGAHLRAIRVQVSEEQESAQRLAQRALGCIARSGAPDLAETVIVVACDGDVEGRVQVDALARALSEAARTWCVAIDAAADHPAVCRRLAGLSTHEEGAPRADLSVVVATDEQAVSAIGRLQLRSGARVCGCCMKQSRLLDMRGRGLLPIVPGAWGVVFVPITSAEPELWELELRGLDALLHKPTDDMVATLDGGDRGGQLRVDFSQASLQLAETAHRLDIAVIDDIAALRVVSDRWTTHAALADLGEATTFDGRRIQVPRAVLLPDLSPASVQTITHVSFPCILKPRVACGPDAAHELAIVPSEAAALAAGGGPVPLPCVAQQYVRHRGTVHKVYCGVVPDKDGSPACRIAVQPRMSSPPAESVEQGAVLRFHSLRDMPKGEVVQEGGLDEELCVIAARRLAQRLQLRLFGFDVVVEDGGAHFIVDVNFLPSLKGVHGAAEIVDGAVALAIREHEQRKRARDGP